MVCGRSFPGPCRSILEEVNTVSQPVVFVTANLKTLSKNRGRCMCGRTVVAIDPDCFSHAKSATSITRLSHRHSLLLHPSVRGLVRVLSRRYRAFLSRGQGMRLVEKFSICCHSPLNMGCNGHRREPACCSRRGLRRSTTSCGMSSDAAL
jgi:hypothetical protein